MTSPPNDKRPCVQAGCDRTDTERYWMAIGDAVMPDLWFDLCPEHAAEAKGEAREAAPPKEQAT